MSTKKPFVNFGLMYHEFSVNVGPSNHASEAIILEFVVARFGAIFLKKKNELRFKWAPCVALICGILVAWL